MKAHVHYEAAFEDYLRQSRTPYVAVNETRRSAFRGRWLKSFDFMIYSTGPVHWLVDVKGRRWGQRPGCRRVTWENWVTRDDLDGLMQWERILGSGFRGLLVFAYELACECDPPVELVHAFRGQRYLFAAVRLDDYLPHARIRSQRWGTVNLPRRCFVDVVRPLSHWL